MPPRSTKRSVVARLRTGAAHDVAFVDLRVATVFDCACLFFGDRAAIDDNILLGDIELDNAAA